MKAFIPPERHALPPYVQWTGDNRLLSPPEVEAVLRHVETLELHAGTIGNGNEGLGEEVPSYRCVETCALYDLPWLYDRIAQKVKLANDEHFCFDLVGMIEPVGYLRYTPAEGERPAGHYEWHQDFGGGPYSNRKLTLIIQLSNAGDYTGCDFQYATDGIWTMPFKAAGDAWIFPSWTPHRVTPIESGVRHALVAWIAGPPFR